MALSYIWSVITYTPSEIEIIDTWMWEELTFDDITVSLEVVSGLKENTKLEVVDSKYLAADSNNCYVRSKKNNSRYRTLSFLKHLLGQIKRHCQIIIENIKQRANTDDNISKFLKIITKMATFIGTFEYISNIYKDDTLVFSSFETVKGNFSDYYSILLRNLITK